MTTDPGEQGALQPPEDIFGFLGLHQVKNQAWVIDWTLGTPDWAAVRHPAMPEGLHLRVRVANTTEDGFAAVAALVERDDGRALGARDLRKVRLPPAWALASSLTRQHGPPSVTTPRPGPRGKGDDHWRAVFNLWVRAQRVAPHAPVRWMLAQWEPEVSDATMRRWVARARERAAVNGWQQEDHDE